MFLVEQNAFGALKLAHRGYVMVNGNVTMSGTGKELLANPRSARRLSRRRAPLTAGAEEKLRCRAFSTKKPSIWQFLFVTCLLGGWAAWMTGQAPARRPGAAIRQLFVYMLLLGVGVRFIHHALFNGTMFTPAVLHRRHHRPADLRHARLPLHAHQPDGDTIYYWLYEKASPLSWKPKELKDIHRLAPLHA